MNNRFAAAINDQGRFAPTSVGDFDFIPEANAHIWRGRIASSAKELSEIVNGAIASLAGFQSPFTTLSVIQVGAPAESPADENKSTLETENEALRAANQELNEVISRLSARPALPRLAVIEERDMERAAVA